MSPIYVTLGPPTSNHPHRGSVHLATRFCGLGLGRWHVRVQDPYADITEPSIRALVVSQGFPFLKQIHFTQPYAMKISERG